MPQYTNKQRLGAQRIIDQLGAGKATVPALRELARDLYTADHEHLTGALGECLRLIREAQERNIKFRSRDTSVAALLNEPVSEIAIRVNKLIDARDILGLSQSVLAIGNAVDGLRPYLRQADTKPKAAEPVPVRVVGMPARETAVKVRRDEAGDITGSFALEQDAVTK